MIDDIFEQLSQRGSNAETAENFRIREVADELLRRSQLHEAQFRSGEENVIVKKQPQMTANRTHITFIQGLHTRPTANYSLLTANWIFTFSAKERDPETGYSYFGSRYYNSDLSIWLSVDPQSDKYASLSPYVYCADNPVKLVDPNGEEIGWIQDNEGNVFWDENTNSIEDFKCNYDGKTGYSYVSDNDNFRSYTLPNGDGKVLVNEWVEGNVTDGCSTPRIELEFSPSDKNCSSGWIQTYYSNVPDADSHNYGYLLPGSNLENRLDFQTIDKTSTTVPYWNPAKESTKLQDMPRRAYNEGAARAVIWGAQSSILVNGRRSVTISWGFSINSNNSGTFYSPRIEKKPNTFHLNAIQLMR